MLGDTDLALAFNEPTAGFPLVDCAAIHMDAIAKLALSRRRTSIAGNSLKRLGKLAGRFLSFREMRLEGSESHFHGRRPFFARLLASDNMRSH